MAIQGIVQTTKTNDWGFTSYKVSNTWYGADSKGPPRASEGDKISFDAFEKAGKDGRTFPTIKLATLKKSVADTPTPAQVASPSTSQAGPNVAPKSAYQQRDTYWTDKATEDKAREPRIVYQAAYERAIQFTDLAIKHGALTALEKAKPVAKLEIIQAFVDEQTARIMREAFSATVPETTIKGGCQGDPDLQSDLPEVEEEGQWS